MSVTSELVDEIVAIVSEQGSLSKDEILEAWPMNEEEYATLREEVLRQPGMKSGGRGRGGFTLSVRRERWVPRVTKLTKFLLAVDDPAGSRLPATPPKT
jgi:hypothetical protein